MSAAPLRLGLAGLGVVGAGVARILHEHAALLARRAGRRVTLVAVSARDPGRDRGVDLGHCAWEEDATRLAVRPDIDVFVEVIGGEGGVALAATRAALEAGKHVVTANKALLAHHGQALAEMAEERDLALRFEAAVAGGIPVIKALTEGLAANRVTRVMGVLNGTCNYILTRMQSTGLPYDEVFEEARALGYLEADPELDVGGIDAGHKLALLASIAFGTRVAFPAVELEGIGNVSIDDIRLASDMGYHIKLLGVARMTGRGLEQRMSPCLVPAASPLGQLPGGTNMVVLEGDAVEQVVLRGPGAGMGPTASAVMADVIDIARGFVRPVFGTPARDLIEAPPAHAAAPAPHYLRMRLIDKPGALAKIATCMGDAGVSINEMRQIGSSEETGDAIVLVVTHRASPADIRHALSHFDQTGVLVGEPVAIRIEEF